MSDRAWNVIVLALAVILAVLIGVMVAMHYGWEWWRIFDR